MHGLPPNKPSPTAQAAALDGDVSMGTWGAGKAAIQAAEGGEGGGDGNNSKGGKIRESDSDSDDEEWQEAEGGKDKPEMGAA